MKKGGAEEGHRTRAWVQKGSLGARNYVGTRHSPPALATRGCLRASDAPVRLHPDGGASWTKFHQIRKCNGYGRVLGEGVCRGGAERGKSTVPCSRRVCFGVSSPLIRLGRAPRIGIAFQAFLEGRPVSSRELVLVCLCPLEARNQAPQAPKVTGDPVRSAFPQPLLSDLPHCESLPGNERQRCVAVTLILLYLFLIADASGGVQPFNI